MECKELFDKKYSVLYQNRFCDQENFDFIFTGHHDGNEYLRSIYKVKCTSFTSYDTLVSESNYIEKSLTSGSSIWIINYRGTKQKCIDTFEMSPKSYDLSNNFIELTNYRNNYCVCSFMNNIYVIGGDINSQSKKTCLKYTTRNGKWNGKATLRNPRS